jgi:predicted nucleotide-binding protein
MIRKRVLFQGSFNSFRRVASKAQVEVSRELASALGGELVRAGLDVVLTSAVGLDECAGRAAVAACEELGADPRERIRTYPYGQRGETGGYFGMVLAPLDPRFQEVRTFLVQQVDAVVAISGGKGTRDTLQKAALARKPVFPVAVGAGGAQEEWERLQRERFANRVAGDLDFLGDLGMPPAEMAAKIAQQCAALLSAAPTVYSRRVFVVHGRDDALKNEAARFLERLGLSPVILQEQADAGRPIFAKLQDELADVGFAIVLLTPDDVGGLRGSGESAGRARQNVVFEHGLLIGRLGPERVCCVMRGEVEIPSDLAGFVYKAIPAGGSLGAIAFELARELRTAGYDVDANKLL